MFHAWITVIKTNNCNCKTETRCRVFFPLELGANPLPNSGIALGAFNGFSTLYVGIAEAKLTYIPKGKTCHFILIIQWLMNGLTFGMISPKGRKNKLTVHDYLYGALTKEFWFPSTTDYPLFYTMSQCFFSLDLPSSITQLNLDYNQISKVEVEDFQRYKNLQR